MDKQLNNNQKLNTRGNKDATWDDVDCKHLNEDKTCQLASELANLPASTNPYACSLCVSWPDKQTLTCQTVHRLAKKAAKNNKTELYLSMEQRLGQGVGTELHQMIPAFMDRPGCNCKSVAKKMNIWGPDTCEKNREHIVSHLVAQSQTRALFSWVPDTATRLVANKLLTSAITKTRAKEEANPPKNKWFCAVTTAPREISTLSTCLESLVVAGFDPFVFAEPQSEMLGVQHETLTVRHKEKKGVWHNWLFSVRYALENSDANTIMTVQDDSLFHPDSKSFIEELVLWPDTKVGFVSLYTPKHYSKKPNTKTAMRPFGVNRIRTRSMWGACALIWPRKVLEELIEADFTKNWLGAPTKTKSVWAKKKAERREEPWRIQNSDTAIGKLMNEMGRTMWFCDPSPVQHFATTSAVSHGGNKGRRNCGRCAEWGKPLEEQVPLQTNGTPLDRFSYDEITMEKED